MKAAVTELEITSLYNTHAGWLRGWLLRHTHCSHKAADLAQDTFCRLLERREVTAAVRTPRSYLATIARRLMIDDVRRARVEAAFLDAHAALMNGAVEPGPDRIAEAVHELMAIARVLDGLAEKPRRAYLLARLDGWSHAEIAVELGVSKSMVKQYVAKAAVHCYAVAYGNATDHH